MQLGLQDSIVLTAVAAMPCAADPVTDLPSLLAVWDGDDLGDNFMAWDEGKAVAKAGMLDNLVGVAHATRQYFG